jgi:hypothetical protein
VVMPAGDNSILVRQSSLAVLPAETSGASRRNGRRSEDFSYQYLKYHEGFLTCCKILRHGTSGFTFHAKEGVLRIFIALKSPSPRSGLNPRSLGPVASTLTTTPPRRRPKCKCEVQSFVVTGQPAVCCRKYEVVVSRDMWLISECALQQHER